MFGKFGKKEVHPSKVHWRRWEDSDRGMQDESFDKLAHRGRSYNTRAQEDRSYESSDNFYSRGGERGRDDETQRYNARDYKTRSDRQGGEYFDRDPNSRSYPTQSHSSQESENRDYNGRLYDDRGYNDQDYSKIGRSNRGSEHGSGYNRGFYRDQSPYRDWEQNRNGGRSQIASDYLSEGVTQTPLGYNRGFAQFQRAHEERQTSHYGKGPKGYKRSNERIHEEVCEALTHDDNIDASDIEVKVESGTVILTGTVDSRASKRYAEECAEQCFGVDDVKNELKVKKNSEWDHFTGQSSTHIRNTNDRDSTIRSDQLQ